MVKFAIPQQLVNRTPFELKRRTRLATRGLLLLAGGIVSSSLVAVVGIGFEKVESQAAVRREQHRLERLTSRVAYELQNELDTLSRDAEIATSPGVDEATRSMIKLRFAAIKPDTPDTDVNPPLPNTFRTRISLDHAQETIRVDVLLKDLVRSAKALKPYDRRVFLLPPQGEHFVDLDGRPVPLEVLSDTRPTEHRNETIPVDAAQAVGLPAYPAYVSSTWVDGGEMGRWQLAVAGSMRTEMERDQRGMLRIVVTFLLTSGLMAVFGYLAFRDFRRELEIAHTLELNEERRTREAILAREGRTATMLTLAAGVAHEVGTPLGLIRLKAESLRENLRGSLEEDDVQTIMAQVDRLRNVVQGFLFLARGEAPVQNTVTATNVVHDVCALVQHRFDAAGVRLIHDIRGDIPPVSANALLLEHALINLLTNACDASPKDTLVELRVYQDDAMIAFDVMDEGEGIGARDQADLLKPFFSRKPHGTGLGLALTHEIARMHRGTITLTPRFPRGATASLRLPSEPS